MKLLFVNQHYGADTPATGVLLDQITRALHKRGHEITVIAGSNGTPQGGLIRRELMHGINLLWVDSIGIGSKSTLRRALHYASYFLLGLWSGVRQERPDAIVAMSTPPLLAPVLGRLLAWYHNVPYYYNVQDLYPDVAWAAGKLPRSLAYLLARFAGKLENSAAGVSTVGKVMAKGMSRRTLGGVTHLPNWADVDEIRPLPVEKSFRKAWGLEGKFIVLYSGNLGLCHDSELIADTVELLRNQSIDFLFVVEPGAANKLRALFGDNPRVHIRPYQPRESLPALLATADAGLVSISRGMSRFVVPCKTFGIMAAGKPVVASSDLHDDLYEITHKRGCGVWAASGDAAGLARGILRLRQNAELTAGMGRRARELAESEYSVAAAVRNWEHWLTGDVDAGANEVTRTAA